MALLALEAQCFWMSNWSKIEEQGKQNYDKQNNEKTSKMGKHGLFLFPLLLSN